MVNLIKKSVDFCNFLTIFCYNTFSSLKCQKLFFGLNWLSLRLLCEYWESFWLIVASFVNKGTLAAKSSQFGDFLGPLWWDFVDFRVFSMLNFFVPLASQGIFWHTSSWLFSQIFKGFCFFQLKNKSISPIFSNKFWTNFTNNSCKTTTGIPSQKTRKFYNSSAHM